MGLPSARRTLSAQTLPMPLVMMREVLDVCLMKNPSQEDGVSNPKYFSITLMP